MSFKNYFILSGLVILLLHYGCNKHSLLESGAAPAGGSSSAAKSGKIIVYTGIASYCGGISVTINNEFKGQVTADSYSDPTCNSSSTNGQMVVTTVEEGYHTVQIRGSRSGCNKTYSKVHVLKGQCTLLEVEF